jgi:tetraacyldisaccharide-1-P 4'-kinase
MQVQSKRSIAGLVAAILAVTCLGFAAGTSHKSAERRTDVTFINMMKFANGDTLPAGTYRMEVPENSHTPNVMFYKDGKVMATTKAKVVTQQEKNQETKVESVTRANAQLLTSISPAGWNESLVFTPARQHGSARATQ